MKRLTGLLGVFLALAPWAGTAAESARAVLWSDSMRFLRGYDQDGLRTLDLTTLGSGINGELTLDIFFDSGHSHATYLEVEDFTFGMKLQGAMALDVSDERDVDQNGLVDFYETAQAVENQVTTGRFTLDAYGNGTLTATWNRAAGSKDGTCVLRFKLNAFQTLVFSHGFEIFEFKGKVDYAPGQTNVTGQVSLQQEGNPDSRIEGPIQFLKTPSDPANELDLMAGGWTNSVGQTLTYLDEAFQRVMGTNYFGYITYEDGDPGTAEQDYFLWNLLITDPNDRDHDAVPDFSDDPPSSNPRKPTLTLARGNGSLQLTIAGEVGRLHEIQQATHVAATNWVAVSSVTLTNDPQVVSLPVPSLTPAFYRVQVQ
jgi:hypothetical protein